MNGDRGELRRLAEMRVAELVAYQDAAYARALRRGRPPRRTWPSRSARRATPSSPRRSPASLYKLMAYKDEYEVARLHLDAGAARSAAPSSAPGAKVYFISTRRCCARSA